MKPNQPFPSAVKPPTPVGHEPEITALRESERRLRAIIDTDPECVKLLAADGSLLEMNPAGLRMIEANSFQQVDHHCVYPLVVEEHRTAFKALSEKVFAGISGTLEFEIVGLKGGRRWLETHASPLRDDAGKITALLGITRDITVRKQAVEALRVAEAKFRGLFDHSPVGIYQTTPEGKFLTANLALARILGYASPEELIRERTDIGEQGYVLPERREEFRRVMAALGTVTQFESEALRKDGSTAWVAESARAVRDAAGKVVCYEGMLEDITERRRAQRRSQVLVKLGAQLNAVRRPHDAGRVTCMAADEIFGWEACSVELINAETGREHRIFSADLIDGRRTALPPSSEPEAITPLRRAIMTQGARLVQNDGPGHPPGAIPFGDTSRPSRSILFAPIRCSSGVVGVLSIHSYTPLAYAPADVEVFQGLADYCGEALERFTAEAARRGAEEKYHSIFEHAVEGIYQSTPEGRYVTVNPAMARIYGYASPDEMVTGITDIGAQIYSSPEDRRKLQTLLHSQSTAGVFECQMRRKDGSLIWIRQSSRVVRDGTGKVICYEGSVEDITERKRSVEVLRASEAEFRSLAESMPQIVWATRPDGWNIYFNRQWLDYTGMTVEESHGHGWNKPFHPDDQQRAWGAWQRATKELATYALECRLRRADGVYRWWLIRGVPLHDAAGKIIKWFGTCTDIEEIKQAEVALRESQRLADDLINSVEGIVWEVDIASFCFTFVSRQAERMLGYPIASWLAGPSFWPEHIHPEDRAWAVAFCLTETRERRAHEFEYRMLAADGRVVWLKDIVTVVSEGNRPVKLRGIMVDITARKRADADLVKLSGPLLRAQDEERHRLARELHDSTAQVFAALAMNLAVLQHSTGVLSADDQSLLAECIEQVRRGSTEVRTIAYLLHPPALEAVGLVRAMEDYVAGFGKRSGVQVVLELPTAMDRLSPTAELTLFRVLQECLGNLHRHSESPTATIRMLHDAEAVTLEVQDAGRGLPEEELVRFRAGQASSGVGMAGMRERLRLLGGRLEIEAALPGLRVRATLPLAEGLKDEA